MQDICSDEGHSGFAHIRDNLPQSNLQRTQISFLSLDVRTLWVYLIRQRNNQRNSSHILFE